MVHAAIVEAQARAAIAVQAHLMAAREAILAEVTVAEVIQAEAVAEVTLAAEVAVAAVEADIVTNMSILMC